MRPEPSRFLLELPQDDLAWETERKVVSPQERMQKGQSHLANIRAQLAKAKGGIKRQGANRALVISTLFFQPQRPVDVALPVAFLLQRLGAQRMLFQPTRR